MIAAFWFLSLLGLTTLACGAGPAAWIWPTFFRGKGIDLAGMMMLGFGLIAVTASYLFLLDFTVFSAVPIALGLSGGLLLARFIRASVDLKSYLSQAFTFSSKHLLLTAVTILIASLLVLPGIVPYAGQQFRIGNDQLGYGITGQYLLDGGKLEPLRTEIVLQTGQDNLPDALVNSGGTLSYNLKVEAEFLLKANRVGYPALIGAVFKFIGQPLVYPYLFLMLFWPTFFLVSILWFFFHHVIGADYFLALGYTLALALNCNLLNNACEGQQSQCFAAPYICLFFVALYLHRGLLVLDRPVNTLALAAALGASIVVVYSEALSALACAGVLLLLVDLCLRQKKCVLSDLKFGLAIAIGLVATGPFFAMWFPAALKQASGETSGMAGYWQPYWATPAEIMGWIDIYTRPGFKLDDELFPVHFAAMIASIPLLGVVVAYLLRAKKDESAFWLAPLLAVTGVFVMTYYIHPVVNYAYMKAYTLLFFPVCAPFYIALNRQLAEAKKGNSEFRNKCLTLLCAAIAGSIITGGVYLIRYNESAQKLPENITELQDINREVDLRSVAIITPFYFDMLGRYNNRVTTQYQSLGMVIPFNWLNATDSNLYLVPAKGMPIYILALKSSFPPDKQITMPAKARIVFQNSGVLLIDTGYKLSAPTYQIKSSYAIISPLSPTFVPGSTDSQQHEWKQLLHGFGL